MGITWPSSANLLLNLQFAEFAIGPISRSWFNDESKARSAGVLFTIPILTSTMSALVSKNLMRELVNHKKAKCLEKLSGLGNQRTNRRNVTSDVRSFRCNERITIDDVFFSTREQPQLNRLVIKGSAVHKYYYIYLFCLILFKYRLFIFIL